MLRTAGVLLAAGASRRMGFRKLDVELRPGYPMGRRPLEELLASGIEPLYIVVPEEESLWLGSCVDLLEEAGAKVRILPCADAKEGLGGSLRFGLGELMKGTPVDAVMIMLGDQPLVDRAWLRRLIEHMELKQGLDYAASEDGGQGVPPVLLAWRMAAAIRERLFGDRGAGSFLRSGEFEGVILAPEKPHLLWDVDTPGDLVRVMSWFTDDMSN